MDNDPPDRCLPSNAFWRALAHHGIAPAAVLRRAGLPASLDRNDDGYVTTSQLFAIWRSVEALAATPAFGIALAEYYDRAGHRPALLAVRYASTFREALHLLVKFKRYGVCFEWQTEDGDGRFAIAKHWRFARHSEPSIAADVSLASLLALLRRGSGVARRLAMSERTLQRRISEEHTTFRALCKAREPKRAAICLPIRRLRLDASRSSSAMPTAGHSIVRFAPGKE